MIYVKTLKAINNFFFNFNLRLNVSKFKIFKRKL